MLLNTRSSANSAPRFNVNGTRAITIEDYKAGNFTSVGDILMQQQIAAARMQSSNQLFSGFQGFAGGQSFGYPSYYNGSNNYFSAGYNPITASQNQYSLSGTFQQYAFGLQQLQSQTAMQMSFYAQGGFGLSW